MKEMSTLTLEQEMDLFAYARRAIEDRLNSFIGLYELLCSSKLNEQQIIDAKRGIQEGKLLLQEVVERQSAQLDFREKVDRSTWNMLSWEFDRWSASTDKVLYEMEAIKGSLQVHMSERVTDTSPSA